MSLTLALVAEGDANTANCWSGSGQRFVKALRDRGVRVDVYDADLRTPSRLGVALFSFHPNRSRWRQRFGLGSLAFRERSRRINGLLAASAVRYDAVIQIGATFQVSASQRPAGGYVLYCDGNVAFARKGAPFSGASRLHPSELEGVARREQAVYDSADRIWTMSQALADSFMGDFAQPEAKLRPIYAGVNNPPTPTDAPPAPPRILFVGKDHARKGSAMLLEAFARVRQTIANAELHLVGGIPPFSDAPGVHAHGVLTRANDAQRATLDQLFATATVFCLPSRYEPFGIAFAEAMLAGLACIGTDRWAMPEIIAAGETGWLVPDGSVDELTRVLIEALRNPARSREMGARGRERALARFTWPLVAERALTDLQGMIGTGKVNRMVSSI